MAIGASASEVAEVLPTDSSMLSEIQLFISL